MGGGFKTFAEVISFAVMREEEAHGFYVDLAKQMTDPFIAQIFNDFANEELKHKSMLLNIDLHGIEKLFESIMDKRDDVDLAQHFQPVEPEPDLGFKEALILAIKREEKSCNLYSFLAESTSDDDLSLLFVAIAKEEERHKQRLEKTYNNIFNPV